MSDEIINVENKAKDSNINQLLSEAAGDQYTSEYDFQKILDDKDVELNDLQLRTNELTSKVNLLENDLQQRTEERENCKNKIQSLETEISELKIRQSNNALLNPIQQTEVNKIKKISEDMLTKAKGIIFDKTKICKNQELQIEALTQQVTSLKEVLSITKDLLEIRNLEVKHLQEKMDCMDAKINAEKQRHDLMNKKMDAMVKMNSDLKVEYETQLKLFDALRTTYATRDELQQFQKNNSH